MSDKSSSVQIRILDKEYQINCPPSDQEALLKSARYLDENMRKVKERGNIHGSEKVAVMAALNITYELLQKNRLLTEYRRVNGEQIDRLEEKIEQALQRSRQLEM
jgi:cell division protein ZapA